MLPVTLEQMEEATWNLPTLAAKARALTRCGATRSDIADFLRVTRRRANDASAPPWSGGEAASEEDLGARRGEFRLSIEAARRGLAASLGVPLGAIEIVIHA
jgi:hypothetical protein